MISALNGNTLDKDDADGKNTMVEGEFNNGLEGVALLMEDLRNAVEATIDAEVADEKGRADFADALLHCMSPGTLTFYRKLLKVQVSSFDFCKKKIFLYLIVTGRASDRKINLML